MAHMFSHSNAKTALVKEVQFGIMSPDDIKKYSVAKIEFSEMMDENGKMKAGGLRDPAMGTIDRNLKCDTCGEGMQECPGHFGHIELARPVFHIGFLIKVKKILECICTNCGRLKIDDREIELFKLLDRVQPKYRLKYVWERAKSVMMCEEDEPSDEDGGALIPGHGGCGHRQPLIRKEGLKLNTVYKKVDGGDKKEGAMTISEKKDLTAHEVHSLLLKMRPEDMEIMGLSAEFARPDWMILTNLPVPPAPVRPEVTVPGQRSGSDDLSYKLTEILKANASVQKCLAEGAPNYMIQQFVDLLQYHVATYMDNDIAGAPQSKQKGGRPIKAIRARLKGKEGRLRGNLMGKRVDFSARTVITGDPNLDLDQVGVPRSIAMNLTYPERVTPFNSDALVKLVENGPSTYPGARFIVKDNGERIDLKYRRSAEAVKLDYGWIVERHLVDGDYILFNRQPSLHKMSMMSHRVKVLDFSTFRLNLSVTSPYNADFDGDEMNLHVPQSEETRAELRQIAWVPRQIVSPQANKPVMGIVQDTLCGIRKLTLKDAFCDWAQVQNILLWLRGWDGSIPAPAILKPKALWTGKQLISLCIPAGINVKKFNNEKPSPIDVTDENVLVEDGEIIHGTIVKAMAGAQNNGLIHVIFREKGPEATRDFFSAIQNMVDFWLLHYGFSVGIGDTIADAVTMDHITKRLKDARETTAKIMFEAERNILTADPGMTLRETFEHLMKTELNKARDYIGSEAQRNLKADNNVKQMVVSGSKGSFINISQMSGCVGQQAVEGKRVPFGFQHRSLPHFAQDDYGVDAGGFVENSYLRGLTPKEFFFHAMAGREGLIDTAVKTAETGYIQRRLVKAMEDVMVCYDGTVRNSSGDILQMLYGEDGMDGTAMERQTLDTLKLKKNAFKKKYRVDILDPAWTLRPKTVQAGIIQSTDEEMQEALDAEYAALKHDRKTLRAIFPTGDSSWPLPVNIGRILLNARQTYKIDPTAQSDLSPLFIVQQLRETLDELQVVHGSDTISREAQMNATWLFKALIRSALATRPVLEEHHLTKEAFIWVLGEIKGKFVASIVDPAEMCGILAAQSIGEPATQMTLNTFHYAGVASKNVTLGVPRLKEVMNVAERIRTPINQVYVDGDIGQDQVRTKKISSSLPYVTIRDVTSKVEIHYDPDPQNTYIPEDADFVRAMWEMPDEENETILDKLSPWVLRLVLDRSKMLDKGIEIDEVVNRILGTFNQDGQKDIHCVAPAQNASNLAIQVRTVYANKDDEEIEDEEVTLQKLEQVILDKIQLGGLLGIGKVFINSVNKTVLTKAGDFDNSGREWFIETQGSNFKEVLAIDGVDSVRTYSNNSFEIFKVLGIEAGRAGLLKELRNVIEFDGSYVNYRHLALLCDLMTQRGQLMSITRHGINRTDAGALAKSSFEETVEILMEAAAMGDRDDCKGVAENVMLGQVGAMGTGAFDLQLDIELLSDVIADPRGDMARLRMQQLAGGATPGGATAYGVTPYDDGNFSPYAANSKVYESSFSPIAVQGDDFGSSQGMPYGQSPMGGLGAASPGYMPTSPEYSPSSPFMTSPNHTSPSSPGFGGASPWVAYGASTSPSYASPQSPSQGYSPSSPNQYSPTSPSFSPTSPAVRPGGTSPAYSPTSPSFSPSSPTYSPTSPAQNFAGGRGNTSPGYSPTSPAFSPSSPAFSPASPAFSPASPGFSPASPQYSATSPAGYSPASPAYSPTSPAGPYSPTSPTGQYSPASPAFSPTSPAYSPDSPRHNGNGPRGGSPSYTGYGQSPSYTRK